MTTTTIDTIKICTCSGVWSSVDEHSESQCCYYHCLYCRSFGRWPQYATEEEQEIRNAYERMNRPLATPALFGSLLWQARSQYGYTLSEHATQTEAEQAVIDYYRTRMNLIRQ